MQGLFKHLGIGHRRNGSTTVSRGSDHQTGDSQLSSESASPRTVNHDKDGAFTTKIPEGGLKQTASHALKEVVNSRPVASELGRNNLVNLSSSLAGAAAISNSDSKESSGENNALDKLINGLSGDRVQTMNTVISTTLNLAGGAAAIKDHISTFAEHSVVLIKALDEVARLHPFVGVAVMAFKTVWTLEMKRRENNQKIFALYGEMRNMMAVLLDLKDVGSGQVDQGRLQQLSQGAADEIKDCAIVCDAYAKTRTIIKVLNGAVWQERLAKFVGIFTQRRDDFQFALTVHSAIGIDSANRKLEHVDDQTKTIDQKMDRMLAMFQKLTTPEERELRKAIDKKGGKEAIQRDQRLLEEVMGLQPSAAILGSKASGERYSLEDLRKDLGDPEQAIKRNMKVFERKLKVQENRISEEVNAAVRKAGDRVLEALEAGPHNRVDDPDVRTLWKDMGWRGSVKAPYFVMSLRDYYYEGGSDGHITEVNGAPVLAAKPKPDEWALAYLDVRWLQPIRESFDDDASGYVTIAEVNVFTNARPPGWSLPHWLAYWAVGWHQSLTVYVGKIREMFAKMFAILPRIDPSNQGSVNKYLQDIYEDVTSFAEGVNPCYINGTLQEKFKDFEQSEEHRLRANLETVHYDIDAMDTLALITGPGRIGKFAHALLYLLLERHFEIFRLCIDNTVHPDELLDAARSVKHVTKAIWERLEHLKSIFVHQRLVPKQQFAVFAHGMFRHLNDPAGLWSLDIVKSKVLPDYPYDDDLERQDIKIEDILKFSLTPVSQQLDIEAYESPPPLESDQIFHSADPEVALLVNVLGAWNGFMYRQAIPTFPVRGMISMTLQFDSLKDQTLYFHGSSRSNLGDFAIAGHCNRDVVTDSFNFTLTRTFTARHPTQYWDGQVNMATEEITGTWDTRLGNEKQRGNFVLKRTAPEDLRFRPAPATLEADKTHSLWLFARDAVLSRIERQSWSWFYFKKRRENRQQFLNLYIRRTHYGRPLSAEELVKFRTARQSLTAADSRFYHSLADNKVRNTVIHGLWCANCRGKIGGARIICLICQAKNASDTVDLCDEIDPLTLEKACVSATIKRDNLPQPHLPTHDVVKVRRVVHIMQFGTLIRDATQALERVRALLNDDNADGPSTPDLEAEYDSDYSSQALQTAPRYSYSSERCHDCTVCGHSIAVPCWYYIHRDVDAFICDDCEGKIENVQSSDGIHDLVRCQSLTPADNQAPLSIKERLGKLEEQFGTVDKNLHQLGSKMDDRLRRVEDLLHSLHGKLKIEEA